MRNIEALFHAHLRGEVVRLALCWRITKKNGAQIFGTDHDRDITITIGEYAGLYSAGANITGSDYKSTADMSVDNMEVEGAIPDEIGITDVTVADIEAGLLDNAQVVMLVCNWQHPDDGQIARHGFLGTLSRDSDGRYRTEIRGLLQLLSQNIGQTFADRCNVKRFGDARCKFDVASATRTGSVTAVTSRKAFNVLLNGATTIPTATYFDGAPILFTSGANAGFEREVKQALIAGQSLTIELYDELPDDADIGDAISIPPACNRLDTTCKDVHANIVNFRGYGLYIPGVAALTKGPT